MVPWLRTMTLWSTSPAHRRRRPCTIPARPRSAECRPPTCAPGCRRCGRNVARREDLVLQRQERAAGIHQIDARQVVLARDVLGAQVLLHRHGIIRSALDGGVVGNDHAIAPADAADAGDEARRRHLAVVHVVRRQRRQLQERSVGIEQQPDALAHQQLAAPTCRRRDSSLPPRVATASLSRSSSTRRFIAVALRVKSGARGSMVEGRTVINTSRETRGDPSS